ncbi:MAG: glycosyltransferase family 39 protein [Acidimicrobiales bacterium]|nr:glycosyltransferase family 39 protein [Acidimicrobiales bacterium]
MTRGAGVAAAAGRRWRDLVGRIDRAGWVLLAVTAAALVIRLVVASRLATVRGFQDGDQGDYQLLAFNLIGGNGYRTSGGLTAWRSPGYPVFLAFVIRAGHALPFEASIRGIVGVAQAFVGAGTVLLTGLLGRRLGRPKAGMVAAAVLAVWPSVVLLTAMVLTETLFTFLLVAAVLVAVWDEDPGRRRCLAAGVLLGAATLVRPAALPVAVVLVGWLIVRFATPGARRVGLRRAGTLVAGIAVVLAPWVFRNYLDLGAFVPTDLHGGYALCQSNRPGAGPQDPDDPACRVEGADEVRNDRILRDRALRWMVEHPDSASWLVVRRAGVLFGEDGDVVVELVDPRAPDPRFSEAAAYDLTRLSNRWWWVVFPVGAVGTVLLLRDRRSRVVALAFLAVLVLPLLVTVSPRFHQPVAPLLALGVGAVAEAAWRRLRRGSKVAADSR